MPHVAGRGRRVLRVPTDRRRCPGGVGRRFRNRRNGFTGGSSAHLNRQTLFREQDLGTPKIDAALTALRALNPHTTVTGERREVRGPADLEDLLTGGSGDGPAYDVLLLAADRPAVIRRWANQVCLASGTPWAERADRGPLVSVGVFSPGRGACWECLRSTEIERRDLRLAPGQDEEAASPRMPWNPVNAVTAGLSGSLLAHAALVLLCGVPPVDPGCRFGLNLMVPGDPVMQRSGRRPDCPACGPGPAAAPGPVAGPEGNPEPAADPGPEDLP
ncbi:Molybdopterin/thiamine biosynthesis adenylyltransferase OS=Streptomyces griseomycini OX=66895 GN=FHS37_001218 PE=4 SV=1 [Streptomyces griseomycini]